MRDAATPAVQLVHLATASLSADQPRASGPVGGISGLTWDGARGRFLAATDDRARPRVFTIDFHLPDGLVADASVEIVNAVALPMPEDAERNPRDAEALAPDGLGGFVIAFEQPFSFVRFDADFTSRAALALASADVARFIPTGQRNRSR